MMRLPRIVFVLLFSVGFLLAAVSAQAVDVTLAWDPNTEQDLAGYGVYFSPGGLGAPYQLAGFVAVTDLEDADAPAFTLSGLNAGAKYALAVTAYNSGGSESSYSEPVCLEVGAGQIDCAPSSGTSGGTSAGSDSGGGGGGGGGCFVTTVYGNSAQSASSLLPLVLAVALGVVSVVKRR
jgi:hypothetical protein